MVTPTAACDRLVRCSPRGVSSHTSEDWQHSTGTGKQQRVPSPPGGFLGDTSFPSADCPFSASLQGKRGCSGNGGNPLISWRDLEVLQVDPNLTEVQGLHSSSLPCFLWHQGKMNSRGAASPSPYYSHPFALTGELFLGLIPVFPALMAAIKHLQLPEDVCSQPCFTISPGALEENETVLPTAMLVARCGVTNEP